jgi:hypothetical protein
LDGEEKLKELMSSQYNISFIPCHDNTAKVGIDLRNI